jgi:hypothetical protein
MAIHGMSGDGKYGRCHAALVKSLGLPETGRIWAFEGTGVAGVKATDGNKVSGRFESLLLRQQGRIWALASDG